MPFYLCYLAGLTFDRLSNPDQLDGATRRQIILSSIMFALGVITIFVGMGAAATAFGQQLREWMWILRYLAAGIIFILGLHFLGVLRIGLLYREARLDAGQRRWGLVGAYLIGLAFAFGWTPCVGPVLATILFTAGAQDSAAQGAMLLLAYGVGMTAPFIVAAVFVSAFLNWTRKVQRHLGKIEKFIGGALVIFALLIGSNSVNVIATWMLSIAPDLGILQ